MTTNKPENDSIASSPHFALKLQCNGKMITIIDKTRDNAIVYAVKYNHGELALGLFSELIKFVPSPNMTSNKLEDSSRQLTHGEINCVINDYITGVIDIFNEEHSTTPKEISNDTA